MQGACSNQIVKCIVYSNKVENGIKQLLKIEKEYSDFGIGIVRKTIGVQHSEIIFDNGEEWITVRPNLMARGYRWGKVYIDAETVTVKELKNINSSGYLYQWEEHKIFGW